MKTEVYVLDQNGIPIPSKNDGQWEFWMMKDEFQVAVTVAGDSEIHTSLMGVEADEDTGGPPFPFITTVRGGELNGYCGHSPNWEQAEAEHAEIVAICEGRDDE